MAYKTDDLQLEFVMLEPYIRTTLTGNNGVFTTKFRTPQRLGMTIRNEIKIIQARIKDTHKIHEEINRFCDNLSNELGALMITEEILKQDLKECK